MARGRTTPKEMTHELTTNGARIMGALTASPGTAIALTQNEQMAVMNGDYSSLNEEQKQKIYLVRCEAAGLDPRTSALQWMKLQGKVVLYATKGATDQLIAIHHLTVEIVDRRVDEDGIYEVQCRVKRTDGSYVDDLAALSIKGLQGEAMSNARMKCVTKAKRRTVLSACGLGLLDESEVESIPGAVPLPSTAQGCQPSQDELKALGEVAKAAGIVNPKQLREWLAGWDDLPNHEANLSRDQFALARERLKAAAQQSQSADGPVLHGEVI